MFDEFVLYTVCMDREIRPPEYDKRGTPTGEWLRYAYLEEQLGIRQIAKLTERNDNTILYLLRRRDIPVRQPPQLPEIDVEWLRRRYTDEQASYTDICAESGLTRNQIGHLLRIHKIPTRRPIKRTFRPDHDWLVQKYVVEGLSSAQICKLTGYSKQGLKLLRESYELDSKGRSLPKLDITREELYQLHVIEGLTAVKIAARLGCHNATISKLIKEYELDPGRALINETMVPPLSHDELWKLYWVDMQSAGAIATRYSVSSHTVLRWMKYHDIPRRRWNGPEIYPTFRRSRSTGPKRRYGQEFDAQERNKILTRDGWMCRMPGCGCTEAWRLEVHHIIPVKNGGTHALTNGITLCNDCHDRILNRELDFATLFQDLVKQHPTES
jgi:5-methylcytosine-specific restriction endonuclease McrA